MWAGASRAAFTAYENNIRDDAAVSQKANAGRLIAPGTRLGIRMRNLLFSSLSLVGPLRKVIDKPASNITLASYPALLNTLACRAETQLAMRPLVLL